MDATLRSRFRDVVSALQCAKFARGLRLPTTVVTDMKPGAARVRQRALRRFAVPGLVRSRAAAGGGRACARSRPPCLAQRRRRVSIAAAMAVGMRVVHMDHLHKCHQLGRGQRPRQG
jgi:hypothetical protein